MEIGRRPTGDARYVVLTFSGVPLVLPHTDVYSLEPRSDVQPAEDGDGTCGWIEAHGRRWPVFCFDHDLRLTTLVPVERRVCVLLHRQGGYAGLLCEAVTTLDAEGVRVVSLPPALSTPESPLTALVLHDDFLGCLTSAVDLLALSAVPADSGLVSTRDALFVGEMSP